MLPPAKVTADVGAAPTDEFKGLRQIGDVIGMEDKSYVLQTCAFDLYGSEFCVGVKRIFEEIKMSYHWIVKRMVGASKFSSNHRACAECKILTWELMQSSNCKKNIASHNLRQIKIFVAFRKICTAIFV